MVADPINMQEFQNAVYDWFHNATGLFTIWRNMSGPNEPEYPYGSLQILNGPTAFGNQWNRQHFFDDGRPDGAKIELRFSIPCSFVISSQVYVKLDFGRDPNQNALWFLNKAQSALSLPSFQDALNTSGVVYFSHEPIQNIDEVIESEFQSRANLDVIFGTSLVLSEYTDYITQVELKSSSLGVDTVVGG